MGRGVLQRTVLAGALPGALVALPVQRMGIARLKSRIALLTALLAAMALTSAPVAFANAGETIIQRCTHGQSLSGFSQSAYSQALKELSADAEEYTDCSSLIRQAQVAAASHRGSSGGGAPPSAGSTPATTASPAEQKSVARAAASAPTPVSLGGQIIHPGVVHASVASALSSLPTPLIATMALLLVCLLLVVGRAVNSRVRAGRAD
jgi:hypothetical protein